mgnify:CR=1 FL=1
MALFSVVVLVMGSGYVAIRIGVETVPPLFLGAVRFYLASLVLLGVAGATGMDWLPRSKHDWAAIFVLGFLVFAGAIGFLFVGQQWTSAGSAAVVMCVGPVRTALIARVLLPGERLSPRQTTGIGLGLLGAMVITIPGGIIPGGGSGVGGGGGAGVGAVLVFCAAISGSLGSVLLGRIRTVTAPTVQTGWGALVGGLVLHGASLGLGEPSGTVTWTPTQLWLLVYLSVAVSGLGYVSLLSLLRVVGPTRTSFTSYGSPIVAVVLSSLLLHESISAGTVIGFATILAGFIFLNWRGGPPPTNGTCAQSESTPTEPVRDAEHARATIEGSGDPL